MSLGGYGTMDFGLLSPDKVAAAMHRCGRLLAARRAGRRERVPLWVMHGTGRQGGVGARVEAGCECPAARRPNDHLLRYDWFGAASHGYLRACFYLQKTYDWTSPTRCTTVRVR
jgi:dienelactone hydrolase